MTYHPPPLPTPLRNCRNCCCYVHTFAFNLEPHFGARHKYSPMWLNICLLAVEIYMRKFIQPPLPTPRSLPSTCDTLCYPFAAPRCVCLISGCQPTRRNLYFTVQLCLCDVCAMECDIWVYVICSPTLLAIFSFSEKQ